MRATFNSKDLTCSICDQFYNSSNRKAMVVCLNMHTICNSCATLNKSKQCPYCKRKYNIRDIVANRYIMQQIYEQEPPFKEEIQPQEDSLSTIESKFNALLLPSNRGNDIGGNGLYFGDNSNRGHSEMNRNQDIVVIPHQQQERYRTEFSSQQNQRQAPSNNSSSWNLNMSQSQNNQNYINQNNTQHRQQGNNYQQRNPAIHQNHRPIQVRVQQNGKKLCQTICLIITIGFLCILGIYFITMGGSGIAGAVICFIGVFAGCIRICLPKVNRYNQRNQYRYNVVV